MDYAHRVKILKPHGSLDWYEVKGRPVRCPYNIDIPPLIVVPGDTKYRSGYKEPFDAHRECANQDIDNAKRYLILGYGFNDDHLQTHLTRNLREGKPALIVTREPSESTKNLIENCPNIMALFSNKSKEDNSIFRDVDGCMYTINGNLWDLETLAREVFI